MTASASRGPSGPAATPVPLIDLGRQFHELADAMRAALWDVCDSGKFVLGPEVTRLEESLAAYCQAKHAIACASGSDALLLALMAIDIGFADEVILPSYTFFATAGAVARLGARPVFVDIDPATFNLRPEAVEAAITSRTRAIMPVHLFGQCAEMDALRHLARQRQLTVIEDAAQAIGAEYHAARAGSMGDMGCFSFYPTKNLGGYGDGGLVTTNRDDLAEKLRLLRVHGMQPRYYHKLVGINSRLDSLQAAVLNVKLPHLDRWSDLRARHAAHYRALFTARGLDGVLGLPTVAPARRHVWNQYVIRIPGGQRDALRSHLAARQIGTEIYYPVPLHEQQCFAYLGVAAGSLPVTEQAARETLALPMFPELRIEEQEVVVGAIADFFAQAGAAGGHAGVPRPKFLDHAAQRADATERRTAP